MAMAPVPSSNVVQVAPVATTPPPAAGTIGGKKVEMAPSRGKKIIETIKKFLSRLNPFHQKSVSLTARDINYLDSENKGSIVLLNYRRFPDGVNPRLARSSSDMFNLDFSGRRKPILKDVEFLEERCVPPKNDKNAPQTNDETDVTLNNDLEVEHNPISLTSYREIEEDMLDLGMSEESELLDTLYNLLSTEDKDELSNGHKMNVVADVHAPMDDETTIPKHIEATYGERSSN